jgi:O-methyltransferase involved in polyketide biosynthesis
LRPNLELLPVDFEATVPADALAAHPSWRSDARTVVAAEGLLIFLAPETIDRLFDAIARATGPGSRFVFSYGVLDAGGRLNLGPVTRWLQALMLRAMGERVRWGVREDELGAFLEARGFRPVGPPERADLRVRYLLPAGLDSPLGGVERVALAEPVPASG